MVQISDPPGGAVEPCVRCGRRLVSPKVGVAPLRREQIVRATIRCLARGAISAGLYARMRRLIGMPVAQGIRAGRFRRVSPIEAAAVILGLLDGVSLQLTFDPQAFSVATAARFCEDALGRYLAR